MTEIQNTQLNKPLVSIITVVYNSEAFIEKTILSIINQSFSSIEYIIVDGGSTDATIEIIKKYEKYISKWITEKDCGLYDAMNKGLNMATGTYVWFINSGDEAFSESVLMDIFEKTENFPDVVYGETEIIDYKGQSIGMRRHQSPENLTWKSLRYGMKVCHQSVLVKKVIAGNYNLKYRYSSDFEWLIEVLKKANTIYFSQMIISKFMDGGQTSKTIIPGLKERFRIIKKHYGLVPTIFRHFILAGNLILFYLKNKRI